MTTNASDMAYRVNTADSACIAEHLRACSDLFNPPLHQKVDIDAYAAKMADRAVCFEAWDGAVLAGLVCAYFNDLENRRAFITNVSTLGSHGGRGIGSALMHRCVAYGEQHGFIEIQLEVHPESASAIHLYRKFGFDAVEERPEALIMKRTLTQRQN